MSTKPMVNAETKAEANVKQAVPFFRVSNIEESVRYYVNGLGFEMAKKWIDEGKLRWCWLQHGNVALMLQEFRKEGHDSWVPSAKVGEGVSICFQCEDALANLPRCDPAWDSGFAPLRRQWDVGHIAFRSGWLQTRIREPYRSARRHRAYRFRRLAGVYLSCGWTATTTNRAAVPPATCECGRMLRL